MTITDPNEHLHNIVAAAAEMKAGARELHDRIESGEITLAEIQAVTEQGAFAAEEMWRALDALRDQQASAIGVAPVMPAPQVGDVAYEIRDVGPLLAAARAFGVIAAEYGAAGLENDEHVAWLDTHGARLSDANSTLLNEARRFFDGADHMYAPPPPKPEIVFAVPPEGGEPVADGQFAEVHPAAPALDGFVAGGEMRPASGVMFR